VLDLVELVLDEPVRRLDITLPGVGARRASRVAQALHRLDRLGELTLTPALPVADELAPVVGLEA
jgi:recombinational DNA repair protein RecR